MTTMQVPVAQGVFTWPSDEPRLIGSRCDACGTYDFPAQLLKWTSGSTYESAVRAGNNAVMMKVHDRLAELGGFDNVDSFKEICGVKSLRIDSVAD